MGIRFCKGIPDETPGVCLGRDIFCQAHAVLMRSAQKYIPVRDEDGGYICSCYNDSHLDKLIKFCIALESSNFAQNLVLERYPVVTLISCNEVAYRLYTLLIRAGCVVYCKGEIWPDLVDADCMTDEIFGFPVFAEGNLGLPINESGMWANAFPENEYQFLKRLYEDCLLDQRLYNNAWICPHEGNRILAEMILTGKPLMAARLGNTEAAICREYMNGYYTKKWLDWLYSTSGFFSRAGRSLQDVDRYAKMTIDALKNCDINLCRFENEISVINAFASPNSINLDWYALYTQLTTDSWLKALNGKRVLVISSATETIKTQYRIREKLFDAPDLLPEMALTYYVPPQTQLNDHQTHADWFDEMKTMCADIEKLEFDVALIAAGAYGYPLASFIKVRLGKQAIELCSGIYPIFGIKVKTQVIIRKVSSMYNNFWKFPEENKPSSYMEIENGAYWG